MFVRTDGTGTAIKQFANKQHCFNQFVDPVILNGCYVSATCAGETVALRDIGTEEIETRECCVNTPALSYSLSGQCVQCVGMFTTYDDH